MFWNRRRTSPRDLTSGGCSMQALSTITLIAGMAFLVMATKSLATQSLMKIQKITPENANVFGVDISSTKDGQVTLVKMVGPIESKEGCPPRRAGSFLLDNEGDVLNMFIVELNNDSSNPQVIGYYTTESQSMGVFIDYICTNGNSNQSLRYEIESISDFITHK